MNAMAELGRRVHEFAKCYVALTEALQREGVPEETARSEARTAALMAMTVSGSEEGESCPFCRRK